MFQRVWDIEEACSTWLFRAVGPYCVDSAHWLRDDRPEGLQALYERKTQLPWRAACWPVLVCVAPLALLHAVCKLLACLRSVAWVLSIFLPYRQSLETKYKIVSDAALELERYEDLPDCVVGANSLMTIAMVFVPALRLTGKAYRFCVVPLEDGVALVRARQYDLSYNGPLLPDNLHTKQLQPWRIYDRNGQYMGEDWRSVFTVSVKWEPHTRYRKKRVASLVQKPPPSGWYRAWKSVVALALFFPFAWLEHLVRGNLPPHVGYRVLVWVTATLLFYVWQLPITAAFLALRVVCQLLCGGWQGCETPKGLCPPGRFWFQGLKYLLAPVLLSARWAFAWAVILACAPLWAVGWCGQTLGSGAAACVSFLRSSNVGDRAAVGGQEPEVPIVPVVS